MEALRSSIDHIYLKGLFLFTGKIIRHCQLFPAPCPAARQHFPAIGRRHPLSETVFVSFFPGRWLKCPFHLFAFFGAAKVMFFLFHAKLYFFP
jgi:hypothetical protein